MVAIINYGMGNLASVQKAFNALNIESKITSNLQEIKKASSIVLPGVGSFSQGMKNLKGNNLVDILTEEVMVKKKPFLGICLGMQLIFDNGNEPEPCKGLGWISGEVKKINFQENIKLPHLGWNVIKKYDNEEYQDELINNFYFIHSYHVIPKNLDNIHSYVHYGSDFVASIKRDNIFATQFHPEKSQEAGLSLIKSYFNSYA